MLARGGLFGGVLPRTILVDELAAMIDIAKNGNETQRIENDELKELGRRALRI